MRWCALCSIASHSGNDAHLSTAARLELQQFNVKHLELLAAEECARPDWWTQLWRDDDASLAPYPHRLQSCLEARNHAANAHARLRWPPLAVGAVDEAAAFVVRDVVEHHGLAVLRAGCVCITNGEVFVD